jgi:chorismate synthase
MLQHLSARLTLACVALASLATPLLAQTAVKVGQREVQLHG